MNLEAKPFSKFLFFILIVVIGLIVFGVGGYWAPPGAIQKLVYRIAISAALLLLTILSYSVERFAPYQQLATAFFIASVAFLITGFVAKELEIILGASTNSLAGIAKLKFAEMLPIVITILVFNKILQHDLDSLYLKKGNWKLNLLVGGGTFLIFFVLFYLQSQSQGISLADLAPQLPWIFLFCFSNGLLEELHFRGLFLKKIEAFLGKHLANLCVALFFALMHAPVQYTSDIVPFLFLTFFLALGWGYLIQKSDSLWGAVVSHAGGDFLVIAGILSVYVK